MSLWSHFDDSIDIIGLENCLNLHHRMGIMYAILLYPMILTQYNGSSPADDDHSKYVFGHSGIP